MYNDDFHHLLAFNFLWSPPTYWCIIVRQTCSYVCRSNPPVLSPPWPGPVAAGPSVVRPVAVWWRWWPARWCWCWPGHCSTSPAPSPTETASVVRRGRYMAWLRSTRIIFYLSYLETYNNIMIWYYFMNIEPAFAFGSLCCSVEDDIVILSIVIFLNASKTSFQSPMCYIWPLRLGLLGAARRRGMSSPGRRSSSSRWAATRRCAGARWLATGDTCHVALPGLTVLPQARGHCGTLPGE